MSWQTCVLDTFSYWWQKTKGGHRARWYRYFGFKSISGPRIRPRYYDLRLAGQNFHGWRPSREYAIRWAGGRVRSGYVAALANRAQYFVNGRPGVEISRGPAQKYPSEPKVIPSDWRLNLPFAADERGADLREQSPHGDPWTRKNHKHRRFPADAAQELSKSRCVGPYAPSRFH